MTSKRTHSENKDELPPSERTSRQRSTTVADNAGVSDSAGIYKVQTSVSSNGSLSVSTCSTKDEISPNKKAALDTLLQRHAKAFELLSKD